MKSRFIHSTGSSIHLYIHPAQAPGTDAIEPSTHEPVHTVPDHGYKGSGLRRSRGEFRVAAGDLLDRLLFLYLLYLDRLPGLQRNLSRWWSHSWYPVFARNGHVHPLPSLRLHWLPSSSTLSCFMCVNRFGRPLREGLLTFTAASASRFNDNPPASPVSFLPSLPVSTSIPLPSLSVPIAGGEWVTVLVLGRFDVPCRDEAVAFSFGPGRGRSASPKSSSSTIALHSANLPSSSSVK